ncbi:anti-sigma-F factor Fin [Dendrosporobacter sp. 1207_IL3150]|uniref:anti-sigma-F factor Fin n=1 Tax=Dendrosporobacter sp. 1207_IL3150 TaxID=3084054 RepID=UPI002FD8AD2C
MKIFYNCECCGESIAALEVDQVDEVKFGFDCLTGEERQDIIKTDLSTNTMLVKSFCDSCIEALGIADEQQLWTKGTNYLH